MWFKFVIGGFCFLGVFLIIMYALGLFGRWTPLSGITGFSVFLWLLLFGFLFGRGIDRTPWQSGSAWHRLVLVWSWICTTTAIMWIVYWWGLVFWQHAGQLPVPQRPGEPALASYLEDAVASAGIWFTGWLPKLFYLRRTHLKSLGPLTTTPDRTIRESRSRSYFFYKKLGVLQLLSILFVFVLSIYIPALLLLLLLVVPIFVFRWARNRFDFIKFALLGVAFGAIATPFSLGLWVVGLASIIGTPFGLVGILLYSFHTVPAYEFAAGLYGFEDRFDPSPHELVVSFVINGIVWAAAYGALGYAADRIRAYTVHDKV